VEAVKTNVLGRGTWRKRRPGTASSGSSSSRRQAVRPTNVMGATKRLAELVIHNMNGEGKSTVFVAVRFGNVWAAWEASSPSSQELMTTGKLTVTHPEASRYFMLIRRPPG